MAAHTVDADDLLIHAEAQIGDSTIMMCDAKPHWAFTPALLQVYVRSASVVVDLARANGATVITEPTDFHGQQQLARFQDPWHNLWWLFEYGATSTAPARERSTRRAPAVATPTRRHHRATCTAPSTPP